MCACHGCPAKRAHLPSLSAAYLHARLDRLPSMLARSFAPPGRALPSATHDACPAGLITTALAAPAAQVDRMLTRSFSMRGSGGQLPEDVPRPGPCSCCHPIDGTTGA